MKNSRVNWNGIKDAALLTGIGGFFLSIVGGIGYVAFAMIDSDYGRSSINEAVETAEILTPQDGRTVQLIDFNTVRVTQGVLYQTFSFALNRVITTANYGNGQQFNEDVEFTTYNDPAAIDRARSEGCTLAANLKAAMEGYDFGIRTSGFESRAHKENLDLADLFIRNNCPPAP